MRYRKLGKTGLNVSEVCLGTWQVGGKWGDPFDEVLAEKTIHEAIDRGVNFIDTADVYRDGASEKVVGKVVKTRSEPIFIATKCGRKVNPHTSEGYTPERLAGFVEDSLRRMKLETIDLIQLHCPPPEVYQRPEIFEVFDKLKAQGKIRNLGVSVEKIEEALQAIQYKNVTTIQIIFNMFRLRPSEDFFPVAKGNNIGVLVRVPLASGLLTGKFDAHTHFRADDHRRFNREGEAFDKGETFSGVDYEKGLKAVEELKELFDNNESLAAMALRWVLMFPEVSTVIAGASRPEQAADNSQVSNVPPISSAQMQEVQVIYNKYFKDDVHDRW